MTDSLTGETLPLIRVYLNKTTIGANTNLDGAFELYAPSGDYELIVRYNGYFLFSDSIHLSNKNIEGLSIFLKPVTTGLDEVVITSKAVNPALRIVKNASNNRNQNRTDKIDAYERESYNKLVVTLDNVSQKVLDKLVFKDVRTVVEDIMSDSLSEDSARFSMAIFISESVNRVFYKKPEQKREEIYAIKTTGMKGNEYNLLSTMFVNIDLYANYVKLLERQFLGPIADGCFLEYDYRLNSVEIDGRDTLFGIEIIPKRPYDMVFKGRMFIDNRDWAINRIDISMNTDPNLNFIEDIRIRQEFEKIDSFWVPTVIDLEIDFQNSLISNNRKGKGPGVIGRASSYMYNYKINEPRDPKFYQQELIELKSDAEDQDSMYWATHRRSPMDGSEKLGESLVDSLQKSGLIDRYIKIGTFLVGTTIDLKYFQIGPLYYLAGYNQSEGFRLRLTAKTSNAFSQRLSLAGHLAYGFRDQRLKYNAEIKYRLRIRPKIELGYRRTSEVEQVGFDNFVNEGTSMFESILRRVRLTQLNYFTENKLWVGADVLHGLSGNVYLHTKFFEPTRVFDFHYNAPDFSSPLLRNYRVTELGASLRISFKETFITTGGDRKYIDTKYPIFNLNYVAGIKGLLGGQFNYHNISLSASNRIMLGRYGKIYYQVKTGKIFGQLPYPELYVFRGNQTWAYRNVGFNMLNYYEFITDMYSTVSLEYHMLGLILNHIPLMRKLKWKEIASFRTGYGTLTQKNIALNTVAADSANGISFSTIKAPDKYPYMEAGLGIGNIFKVFRIDFYWRINYLQELSDRAVYKNFGPANNLGVRFHLQVRF